MKNKKCSSCGALLTSKVCSYCGAFYGKLKQPKDETTTTATPTSENTPIIVPITFVQKPTPNQKIITTKDRATYLRSLYKQVKAENESCPGCGNTEDQFGLGLGLCYGETTWCTGVFKFKHMKSLAYSCHKCGCKWESRPFEWV